MCDKSDHCNRSVLIKEERRTDESFVRPIYAQLDVDIVELDRNCKVQIIRGDGNCLFGEVVHQLFQCEIPSVEHSIRTREMRNKVVEFIYANLHDFRFVKLMSARVRCEFSHLYVDDDRVRSLNF